MIKNTYSQPVIEFIKVTKIYPPNIIAVKDISFTVKQGEILFLTGMSGAGKTTILKLICLLEHPTRGMIEILGQDLSKLKSHETQELRQKTGVAYQDFKILPSHTVSQNIAMPMEVAYASPKKIRDRINFLLDTLNLSNKRDVMANRLSRGEQQRVTLARAAANCPPLLLADEPTGNLDPTTTKLVVNLLETLHENGTTIVIATHDTSIYQGAKHRVINIDNGKIQISEDRL